MKNLKMPGAFSILFFLTIISVILTHFIPAGQYAKLLYDKNVNKFEYIYPNGEKKYISATQDELDKLNIKIDIKQFSSGVINKPISIPNTYERLPKNPAGIFDIPKAMVDGTIEAVDIMVFILVLGGLIGIIKESGAFEAGLSALSKKIKQKQFLFVFFVSLLMSLGGTLCGIEEEAVAFYPILVPVFLSFGYDSIVCVGAIFLASSIGTTFSTINPFSSVIASNAAGINFISGIGYRTFGLIVGFIFVISYIYWYIKKIKSNPKLSYSYEDRDVFNALFNVKSEDNINKNFSFKKKIILILFVLAFILMICGVMFFGWWFPKMASSFLAIALIIMLLLSFGKEKLDEKHLVDSFIEGASSLVGVSLIIGLARGINMILNQGYISDTILHFLSSLVSGMNGILFVIMMIFVFFILGFLVPSSSGLAVLSMPIFAPLADSVGIPRYILVEAYQYGQYAMLFLAPTGLVMATLQMLDMRYSHWFRFVYPVVLFLLIFSSIFLSLQVMFA